MAVIPDKLDPHYVAGGVIVLHGTKQVFLPMERFLSLCKKTEAPDDDPGNKVAQANFDALVAEDLDEHLNAWYAARDALIKQHEADGGEVPEPSDSQEHADLVEGGQDGVVETPAT